MADASPQKAVNWTDKLQAIALVIASIVGFYEFVYKDILAPKGNVSISVQISNAGIVKSKKLQGGTLAAIKMTFTTTNTSSKQVRLYPGQGGWVAHGYSIKTSITQERLRSAGSPASLLVGGVPDRPGNNFIEQGLVTDGDVLAHGPLFPNDSIIQPGETVVQELIFHVPVEKYDWIDARATLPHSTEEGILGRIFKQGSYSREYSVAALSLSSNDTPSSTK